MTIFGDNEAIDPRAIAPVPTTRDWREVRERDDNGALMAPRPPIANEARKLAKRNGMVRP